MQYDICRDLCSTDSRATSCVGMLEIQINDEVYGQVPGISQSRDMRDYPYGDTN